MLDTGRLVEIRADKEGTGFLLNHCLILTSSHLFDLKRPRPQTVVRLECRVQALLKDSERGKPNIDLTQVDTPAEIIWPEQKNDTADNGFALLLLSDTNETDAFAEWAHWRNVEQQGCIEVAALGYPDLATDITKRIRDTKEIKGEIELGSGLRARAQKNGLLVIKIRQEDSPKTRNIWKGMSGAPVFAGNELIGIIIAVESENQAGHQFHVRPIDQLFDRPEVRQVIRDSTGFDIPDPVIAAGALGAPPILPSIDDSCLERLEDEIRSPHYKLEISEIEHVEKKYWTCGSQLRYYASLAKAFAVLKAGPEECVKNKGSLASLYRAADDAVEESVPARWLAGRIQLSIASQRVEKGNRIYHIKQALSLLSSIPADRDAVRLRRPVLLPGVRQEFSEEEFIGDIDRDMHPYVARVSCPHRYIAATAVMLGCMFPGESYLDNARRHCNMILNSKRRAPAASINGQIIELIIKSVARSEQRRKGESVRGLERQIEKQIEAINSAEAAGTIDELKKTEWVASCHALLALVSADRSDVLFATAEVVNSLKKLTRLKGAVPDYIALDPIYRLAIDGSEPGWFEECLRELGRTLRQKE